MKLKPQQVRFICQKILVTLRSQELIRFKKPELEALTKMEEIFLKDLSIEDQINREAETLLEQYAHKMGPTFDREKMFQMIKTQLVKDKNVII